jgi:hypothetical protein
MKKNLLLIIFTFLSITHITAQELSFEYDNAGNQIKRQWVCINCPPPYTTFNSNGIPKITGLEDDLNNREINKGLSVYPNPLKEILNISWYSNDEEYVKSLEVLSLTGVKLYFSTFKKEQNNTSISFFEIAAGTYLLKVNYSTNRQEIVKIIKQ